MAVLSDSDLVAAIGASRPLAIGSDANDCTSKDAVVQPASLTLRIGEIMRPCSKSGELGSADRPFKQLVLREGETAVVRTIEKLQVPADTCAIGFPPSHVSLGGLLMTNPGHVDPGYYGHLHCTVINMGQEPYSLKQGDAIMRLVFIQLIRPAATPFDRRTGRSNVNPINEELLSRLSKDFLNVQSRSEQAAKRAVERSESFQKYIFPFFTAVIAGSVSYFVGTQSINKNIDSRIESAREANRAKIDALSDQVAALDGRLSGFGGEINLDTLDRRIKTLEKTKKQSTP